MDLDRIVLAVCVVGFTLAAAWIDWRAKRLPNSLTVPVFVAAIVFHVVVGAVKQGIAGAGLGLLTALGGFAVGFGMLFVVWAIGSGGGGDVKYMGALGAWLGPVNIFYVFLGGVIVTLAASIGVLAVEAIRLGFGRAKARYVTAGAGKVKGSADRIEQARQQAIVKRRLMPWAVPAGIASWLVLAHMLLNHVQR